MVVSRLDHDANVRPWVQAAEAAGATVRWAEFDRHTGELPAAQYADLVGERTRLVAVTAGSNAIGTMPDVAAIAETAHAVGALVCVDGVHSVPHGPTDLAALGADFLVTSAYKWSGPAPGGDGGRPGALGGAAPGEAGALLRRGAGPVRVRHAELPPAGRGGRRGGPPGRAGPGRPPGTGGARLRAGLAAAQAYEEALLDRLLAGLAAAAGGHRARLAGPALPDGVVPARRDVPGGPRRRWARPGSACPSATTTPTSTSRRWVCATAAGRCGPASTTTTRPTRWTGCSANWTRLAGARGQNGRVSTLVEDNPAKHRFEILVDDALAGFTAYLPRGEVLVFTHTEVDRGSRARASGGALVRGTLDQLRAARHDGGAAVPVHGRVHRQAPRVRRPGRRPAVDRDGPVSGSPVEQPRRRPGRRPGSRRGWPGAPRR